MSTSQVVLFDNIVAAKLSDMTYPESEASVEAIVEKEKNSYQRFRQRDVTLIFGSRGFAHALGGRLQEADKQPAMMVEHPIERIENMDQLDWTKALFENNKRAQQLHQAAVRLEQDLNGEASIRFCMGAPFSLAATILPAEQMMKAMLKNKNKVHDLLQASLDLQIKMVDAFSDIDHLIFHLSDPMASPNLIGPSFYHEFAAGYTQALVDHIHKYDKEVTLHICGDTVSILEAMADTGADILSLDQVVDLSIASQLIGSRAKILGNIDPIRYLRDGQAEDVETEVDRIFDSVCHHPGGFLLGPGCDIPYDAPEENIATFVRRAKQLTNQTVSNCESRS